jgi:hypothetical protein
MASSTNIREKYEQTPVYDQFVDEYEIINGYVDMFIFAACVGYANERYLRNYGGDSEMLWMHVSNKEIYKAVAASIAYQHHNDPEALLNKELQLETLAMYSAGGAELLENKFGDIKGDPTDAILNYIQEWDDQNDTKRRDTVLGEIMSSFESEPYADKKAD